MDIVAPVSRYEEIGILASAGADEFYCGVVPREWVDRFRTSGVSRRLFANLPDMDALARAVETAHGLDKSISLALNAQQYTGEMTRAIVDLAGQYAELGGDAVIVSDPVVVGEVSRQVAGIRIHVSSIASCHNTETARFFRDLGATRIILPRHVTLAEVAEMAAAVQDVEFEVFALNDGCVYEEGACHSIHLPVKLGGAICMDDYEVDHARWDGRDLTPDEVDLLTSNEKTYSDWLAHRFGCGSTATEEGWPLGPCGLCALPALADCGVVAVKIVGREASIHRKQRSVELVATVRDTLGRSGSGDAVKSLARAIRKRPELCADGFMCYYPDSR